MDILYRDVPENIRNLILDKQCELQKKKQGKVSQSQALNALLKQLVQVKNEGSASVL
jgi:hypothetical protein